ncbi:MAG: tyrosine-type recombinase/integrase [Actinomadura sp.]
MAVYDRWHTKEPRKDPRTGEPVEPCRRHKLYPSAEHGQGDRWQVRWRNEAGTQCKANRPKKGGGRGEGDPDIYAEALDAKIEAEMNAGTYIDPRAGTVTLEQRAKLWRSGLTSDPASLETFDRHLAHIYDVEAGPRSKRAPGGSRIGHLEMRTLTKSPSLIQQWIKGLEGKDLSPVYIKSIAGTLSSIFNAAIDDGIVARNPLHSKSVTLPTIPERTIIPWTAEMVEAARAEVDRRHQSPAMVDLGAGAGLRESEVFGFAEEDIVFLGKDRKLLIRRQVKRIGTDLVFCLPKRGKEREVPLSDALALRLTEQIKKRPPVAVTLPWGRPDGKPRTFNLLFLKPDGLPWYRQTFKYTWNKAREAAGAPPPPDENGRFHGLRHTYASTVLAAGADVRKLAAWLGHTDPGFTLRTYTHFMADVTDVGRKAVDAFFASAADSSSARNVPSGGRS